MMWSTTVIFSVIFCCINVFGQEGEVFDVTTIFDVGNQNDYTTIEVPGRVHSRTNALGLSLYNGFNFLNKSVKPNITCDSIENVCSWTLRDWALKPSSLPTYSFDAQKESFLGVTQLTKIVLRKMQDEPDFEFILYLTKVATFNSCEKYHEMKISTNALGSIFSVKHRICGCHISDGPVILEFESLVNHRDYYNDGYDNEYVRCEDYDEHFTSRRLLELRLKNRKLYLSDDISKVMEWTLSDEINFLYLKGGYHKFVQLVFTKGMSYVSNIEGSEMVSPMITLDDRMLCLTLVFHASNHSKESVLNIFGEGLSTERDLLYSVKNVTPGWNINNFKINFPSRKSGPMKLVIMKTNLTEIKIARISSCSLDGEEVEIIPPVKLELDDSSRFVSIEPHYSATAHAIEPAEGRNQSVNTLCLNGGVLTSAGCACSPGFFGSNCRSGCGRNHYGQDCGGLCSLRSRECQGLLLCTHSTGCQCAPGYRGSDCMEECSSGYYGNNCQQECGRCAVGYACDIYTGECSGCEFGYLPPYCDKESVYYPLPPQLASLEFGVIMVTFDAQMYKRHLWFPRLYQIQYKEEGHEWKTYITKKYPENDGMPDDSTLISEKVEGLRDGILYRVRVLLMDDNFNKYDGVHVGVSEIITKCYIPELYNYSVIHESSSSSLTFSWADYVNTSLHWCPLEEYEVSWKEGWQWLTDHTYSNSFSLTDLLPGSSIQFKVRAKTSGGFSPYSNIVSASTQGTGFSSVQNLNAETKKSSSVDVSWKPPKGSEGRQLRYAVSYMCIDRPACSVGCQEASYGQQSVQDTHITLSPLLPFTQYKVTVTPENGQPAFVYVGTADVVPMEVPSVSAQSPVRTNTSVTVFWDEVPVCSGFFLGYHYKLTKESESLNILDSGFVRNTSVTLYNLTASTHYTIKVFISTNAGWNPDSFLALNVSTSATVPDAVRNLTVYKRGRGMLGLRWAEPRSTYGQLKSFTVTHTLGQEATSHTVEPSHCVVWPDLYCHTIEGLRSNRRYNVSVSARNAEVAEDGEFNFVSAVTKESPPSAPVNLKVTNRSSTSIILEWNYPEMANGVVRSFLISVEETEKYDQDSCCQVYPFVEISVKEELPSYSAEVSGLHPASTYFVSVSGKTVGLGPSQTLVAYTSPPHLPFTSLPRILEPELTWLPQEKPLEVNNSDVYTSLIRVHLLLAVINETQPALGSGITDPKLNSFLQETIGKPFYFIAEYNQDDDIEVTGSLEDSDSAWGRPPASLPPLVSYQLVATQILEYNGVYNVDLRHSESVTLSN